MKYTILFLLFMILLIGCKTNQNMNYVNINTNKSIEYTIQQANLEITKYLKLKGVALEQHKFVYEIIGSIDNENIEDPCKAIDLITNSNDINEKMRFSSGFVVAFLLDKNSNYKLKSSNNTLIKRPDQLNAYSLELKMIELANKNDYLSYIKIMNCNENYIIGYKKGKVDIYKYTDSDLTFIYSK